MKVKTMATFDGFFQRLGEKLSMTASKCMLCGRDVFDSATGLCEDCVKSVTFNDGPTCIRCGVRVNAGQSYCTNCNFGTNYFDRAYSAFVYEGGITRIIYAVKFGGHGALCKVLANYLAYLAVKNDVEFDGVCFVPMTPSAEKRRGYNQSRLLAECFCDIMDCNVLTPCLVKTKETSPQEGLTRQQRIENVQNAYKCTEKLKGKNMLIIDDVKTTGSTLNNCAKALKKAGAKSVVCLTIAARDEQFLMQ